MKVGKGFTLMEMVVVIAIIGIMSIGVVSGSQILYKRQMEDVAKEVQLIVEVMQQEAALRNIQCRLMKTARASQDVLLVEAEGRIEKEYVIPSPIKLYIGTESNPFASGKVISFNQDLSPSNSGTITIMHQTFPYKLKMTVRPVTGLVTIYPFEKDEGGIR